MSVQQTGFLFACLLVRDNISDIFVLTMRGQSLPFWHKGHCELANNGEKTDTRSSLTSADSRACISRVKLPLISPEPGGQLF